MDTDEPPPPEEAEMDSDELTPPEDAEMDTDEVHYVCRLNMVCLKRQV